MKKSIKAVLDEKLAQYYNISFIDQDPISIPHRYKKKQDIEIAAFFASMLAFGRRDVILCKAKELLSYTSTSPHDFVLNFTEKDSFRIEKFKHRTVSPQDILHLIKFFKFHYTHNDTLEVAFAQNMSSSDETVENGLTGFQKAVFSIDNSPQRTKKHIPSPINRSSCKRLNMFLRWMVRKDDVGVDFGIWTAIKPSQLMCPCDVHVVNTARRYGLITKPKVDWAAALELTRNLREFCSDDPVKYDFALFGIGIESAKYEKGLGVT